MPSETAVIITPHTHWDREWYEPESRFRQRLVAAVDELLGLLEQDQRVTCFLLDGQSSLVDDYLAVRPEQRDRVRDLVENGRVLIGPWYTLSDELLSSDEALVRNLLEGRRASSALGAWLDVGYSPDAFGHSAALPAILNGFGISNAIVWRGYGDTMEPAHDLFLWRAPDGASVVTHHLPPSGYDFCAELPPKRKELIKRWKEIAEVLVPRAGNAALLLLCGADHHAAQSDIGEAVDLLNGLVPGFSFRIASPADYFAEVSPANSLRKHTGELRFSYRYAWTLQGVHATRCSLKRTIAEGDELLTRWAEPQAALALLVDGIDRRPLLRAAWREHLHSLSHDSFGGCVADAVAEDVRNRAARVVQQARGILLDSLHDRLGQDLATARRGKGRWSSSLVVINPSPYPRSGVLETIVTVFRSDVVLGTKRRADVESRDADLELPTLRDQAGNVLPLQVLGSYDAFERLDSPRDYPDQDRVRAFRVGVRVPTIPAFGHSALSVGSGRAHTPQEPRVRVRGATMLNEFYRVAEDSSGGFSVTDLKRGLRCPRLGTIEDERDAGDTYTFQPIAGESPLKAEWSQAKAVWKGPLIGSLSRDFTVGDRVRGTLYVRLDEASRLIRFALDGINLQGDHRLRIIFPLPKPSIGRAVVDMQYGPVTRERVGYDRARFPLEWPVSCAPMQRYVSVGCAPEGRAALEGLTVFGRGLYEYELTPGDEIAVTLLRAVGELSKGDLAARPGHAGWPTTTPGAQELGYFRGELAVSIAAVAEDSGPEKWSEIESLSEEFHAPLSGRMLRYGIDVPGQLRGPELGGDGLAFRTLKSREEGPGYVLRCVNLTRQVQGGAWRFPHSLTRAFRARLDETPVNEIRLGEDRRAIRFTASPREIVTIIVEP